MPPLVIILITSTRTEYAIKTVQGLQNWLIYPEIEWYIAGDHTTEAHLTAVLDETNPLFGYHAASDGYGGSVNKAWQEAAAITPVTLWLEDDFVLTEPLDVTPYVKLLMERDDVGMIRLGHLPIDLEATSVGYDGRMYLNIHKSRQYAFSGNPHLKHWRMWEAYGPYPVGLNPGETEISYDSQVRAKEGPAIWWPLAIGDRFIFSHIGERQSY